MSHVLPELWRSTFLETQGQALRTLRAPVIDTLSGEWVDVAAASSTSDWSDTWPQQQWHIAFEILFCQAPPGIEFADDLLFFVKLQKGELNNRKSEFFARRRGSALPPELQWGQPQASYVDWRASTLLNLVVHTPYRLTVLRCNQSEMGALAEFASGGFMFGSPWSERLQSEGNAVVVKVVHASPLRVHVNLDQTRANVAQPEPAYPDICFAVDDFAEAFDGLLLDDPSQCYCVILHANVAGSWARALKMCRRAASAGSHSLSLGVGCAAGAELQGDAHQEQRVLASDLQSLTLVEGDDEYEDKQGTTVFSGFVTCGQLVHTLNGQTPRLLQAMGLARPSRIRMRGPGGVGVAEVAVSFVQGNTETSEFGGSSDHQGQRLPRLVRGAVAMTKGIVGAASASMANCELRRPIRCALMSVSVLVDELAESILKA